MKLFNLFFKTKEDKKQIENTLNIQYKSAKKKINEFIKLVKPVTAKRIITFNNLMSFALDGEQWTNEELKNLDGEMDLTFNFSENYIDRYMARLFPRNPHTGVLEIGVKSYETDIEKKGKFEKIILDFYKEQDLVTVLLEQGINYLCGGGAIFYYPQDPITKKTKLISLDPKDCYFGWKGRELVQFAYQEYVGDNKYNIYYWDLNEFLSLDGRTEKIARQINKFNFIPVSWIPNNPKPHSHEGRSKLLSLYNLDRAYNSSATDFSQRIKDNTFPPLATFSDTVSLKDIDRGAKKKTKLAQGDKMEYLELQAGGEIIKYLDLIEKQLKAKAGMIDSSGSLKTHVSGLSLSYQYSDMMDLIGFMRIFWDVGFRKINKVILSHEFGEEDYLTDPIYHPFLNIDSKQRVEEYAIMLDKKLISHQDAIDELRGVESPCEKLDEIIEEARKFNIDDNNNNNKENDNNKNNGE